MTFEDLYTTYYPDVYRFSVWLTRDSTQAEDVASETFIRAWAQRDRLRTETLKGYLFAIARNLSQDHRDRGRSHEPLGEEHVDGSPDPQRSTAARMDLDRIGQALQRMHTADRLALVLRTEQSLPYDEIARILDISAGAARVKVHRARRRLLAVALNHTGGG